MSSSGHSDENKSRQNFNLQNIVHGKNSQSTVHQRSSVASQDGRSNYVLFLQFIKEQLGVLALVANSAQRAQEVDCDLGTVIPEVLLIHPLSLTSVYGYNEPGSTAIKI